MSTSFFSALKQLRAALIGGSLVVVLTLLIAGCDFESIGEDLGLRINFSPAETIVSGQVNDARTTTPLEGTPITIRFTGPDAGRVVDVTGESVDQITIPEIGLINFGIDGPEPSESSPAEVVMNLSAPGYLETSERLRLTSAEGTFSVNMVNLQNLPNGVANMTTDFATQNGAPMQDVTVQTNPETGTGAQASLRIPEGTVIRDGNGTPLSGTLSASVTYFSNQNDDARASFPGGFSGLNITENEDGSSGTGTFITAGFAAVDVRDEQGREAEQFDGPIDISIDVPDGTENFETGQPIQDGDQVPVYSFDEDTGEWTFEGRSPANVVAGSSSTSVKRAGLRTVSFQTDHLTYWNLDYFYGANCRLAELIRFPELPQGFYRWRLDRTSTGEYFKSGSLYRDFLRFYNAPRNLGMTLRVFTQDGSEIANQQIADLCGGATVEVDRSQLPEPVTVEGELTIQCSADELVIRPSNYAVWYRPVSGFRWNYARMENGRITIPGLIDGSEYFVWVLLKDRWEFRRIRLVAGGASDVDGVTVARRDASTYDVTVNLSDETGALCN